MPTRTFVLAALLSLALTSCGDDATTVAPSKWSHTVTKLKGVPGTLDVVAWMNADGVHAVFQRQVEGGVTVVVNSKPGATFSSMPVTWGHDDSDVSPDAGGPALFIHYATRHVAHPAALEGGVAFVIDGAVGPTFDRLWPLQFSPDGKRSAYVALRGEQQVVILDGKEHALIAGFASASPGGWPALTFSPDGSRFAFVERAPRTDAGPGRERAWIDGVAKTWFDTVRWLRFAPDSKDVVYVATDSRPQRQRLVRNDTIGPAFTAVGIPTFSPDGEHVAYYGARAEGSGLVLDNAPQTAGMTDIMGPVVFSPDSKRTAYVASVSGGWQVVLDGKPGTTYARISGLRFAPDGKRLVYVTGAGGQSQTVVGDAVGPYAQHLWPARFSPDGTRYGYRLKTGLQTSMVIDGVAAPVLGGWASDPVFSPSGQTIAYDVHGDGSAHIVLDGERGPAFERILPDGGADGAHGRFHSEDEFHYLALRAGAYHLVEAKRNL
jgi:Tol biopolymer transport system component